MWYSIGLAAGLGLAAALSPLPVGPEAPRNISIHYKQRPTFVMPACTTLTCRDA